MLVNSDRSLPGRVDVREITPIASPEAGVSRVMLERDGGEVARATSVVTYAAGSRFSSHTHAMGEEFLVLEGTFEDEHGAYPAGTYVRNPWGTSHAPFSTNGCVLFVKLRQMLEGDTTRVVIRDAPARCLVAPIDQRTTLVLHHFESEEVWLERWAPEAEPRTVHCTVTEEFFVLEGEFTFDGEIAPSWTWLRAPASSSVHVAVGSAGGLLLRKR
jgi:anti-sigma factor ChrR (cupin superfamily)